MNLGIDVIAAYMVAISAVSLVFVQTIKTVIINRTSLDDAARLALIQLVNYLFNFGLLLAVLAMKQQFDPNEFLFYLAAPLAQVGGSSTAFNFITTTHASQRAQNIIQAAQDKVAGRALTQEPAQPSAQPPTQSTTPGTPGTP